MSTEADTCRTLITPKLQAAGWDTDPHSIAEQRYFTDGRIVVRGSNATRRKGKRADYGKARGKAETTMVNSGLWLISAFSLQHSAFVPPAVHQLQSLLYAA